MRLMKVLCLGVVTTAACGIAPGEGGDDQSRSPGETVQISDELYALNTAFWANGNVPVCWEAGGRDIEKSWVRNAVGRTWETSGQVAFTGWGTCPAGAFSGVRINWSDEGPHTKGLGTQIRGTINGMVLNPTFANWSPTCAGTESTRQWCIEIIAVHEFGHALGFAHEQNRADTPATCKQAPQGGNGNVTFGAWDLMSVMNYCNPTSNNGGVLSSTDVAGLVSFYGGPMCSGTSGAWAGCRGTGCTTCSEKTGSYPLYKFNHPKCGISTSCAGSFHTCNSNCPAPTSADSCGGTSGQWAGCRGNGCSVCQEKLTQYPNYAKRHPKCAINTTCAGVFGTCNSNCPAPTDLDK